MEPDLSQLIDAVFQRCPDPCIVVEAGARIGYCNPATGVLLGHEASALVGRPAACLFPEGVREAESLRLQAVFDSGRPVTCDTQCVTRNGALVDVALSLTPFAAPGAHSHAVLVTVRDMTSHKQAEAALLDREFKLSAIVHHSPSALSLKTPDGRYALANPNLQKIHGLPEEDIVGKTDFDLYPRPIAQTFQDNDRKVLQSLGRHAIEELVPVNGRMRIYMSHIFPVLDRRGVARFVCRIALDITDQRQAEAEIRKLAQAVEQNPESVIITNPQGVVEFVNDAFVQKSGYAPDEVCGKTLRLLRSGKTPNETYTRLWQTIRAGRIWQGEFVNRRKDGTEYIDFATISPIRQPDGRISHYTAVQQEITERKRTEQELARYRQHLEQLVQERTNALVEAKNQAEAANIAKSAFLANMSHEIRTPLNAIAGMAHLIKTEPLTQRQRERLDKLDAASEHLLEIINAVLELSKIDAGKFVLQEHAVHVDQLLENVASILKERMEAKRLAWHTDVAALPQGLVGDATRLQQALINYVGNAIKFTDTGGITVRVRVQEDDPHGAMLRFDVVDTGVGIEPQAVSRLFSTFEQADNSATRKYGGTGLGLAITRKIAQLMGGDAGVQSTLGQGSTFWFTARLKKDRRTPDQQPRPAPQRVQTLIRERHAGARILLAEDEPINREVALALLEEVGLHTDVALNGAEAVQLAQAHPYDLVLMDVQMPVMNGLEATQRILQTPAGQDLPILAMTANAFAEDRQRCLAVGMKDFIAKPVQPHLLYATLLHWLSARAADRPRPEPAPAHAPQPAGEHPPESPPYR